MSHGRRVVVVTLIVCLVPVSCGDWAPILLAATRSNPVLAKQQVELFGVGAEVKVKLASGKKLGGWIGAIDASGFALISPRAGSPQRIAYEEVAELKMARSTYRASGAPNIEEARRVVAGLGIGKHIMVKVSPGKTFRGHLRAISKDHFVLLPDREAASIEIAYGEVQQLGPNLSKGEKILIIVAVAAAVTAAVVAIVFGEPCEEPIDPSVPQRGECGFATE